MGQPEEFDNLQKKDGAGQQQTYCNGMPDKAVNNADDYNNTSYNDENNNNVSYNYNDRNYNNGNYNNGNYNNSNYNNINYNNINNNGNYNSGRNYNNNYYSGQPQNNNPYQNYQNNSYQNNPYGYQQGQAGGPYGNNPYSPYAAPAGKNNVPLIIGIVAAIIILFLIAVAALTYRAVSMYSEGRERSRGGFEADEYESGPFDQDGYGSDGYDYFYDYGDDPFGGYGYDYDYGDGYFGSDDHDYFYDYGDDPFDGYDYDYDYDNDQYYTLHDDIKTDLSYSVDFDEYEYTDDEKVVIRVSYPVIEGKDVRNLDHLNDVIQGEVDQFNDLLEEYKGYLDNEDSFFSAVSLGYVTYMDEEKLSIVFSENVYADLYSDAYLYCINIDMENGVILENENMLSIDDDFSVEFRTKSDIQNGENRYLTGMTDQEITGYFNSDDVIVFYTPKGMEIGFNFMEGWVTVTYDEYEKYLKVF